MHFYIKGALLICAFLSRFADPEVHELAANPEPSNGRIALIFKNMVGSEKLVLNSGSYTSVAGEQFIVTKLQYYVSNLAFHTIDGHTYTVPQDSSYFLIKESDPESMKIQVTIPAGVYDRVEFTLGVDSLRNTMDISRRTGALDPAGGMDDGMYWGWNMGYVFLKLEGISPSAPVDPSGQRKFRYHIGGFGGYSVRTINNIKIIQVPFKPGEELKVGTAGITEAHILADILKIFNGPTIHSIAAQPTSMFSEYSIKMADNYSYMFRHDHTQLLTPRP